MKKRDEWVEGKGKHTTNKHKMTEEIRSLQRGNSYNLVLVDWSLYKYKWGDAGGSGRHGCAFGRGHLLHWSPDGGEGFVIFFLAEGRTGTTAAAVVRYETGLPPSWGHRLKIRHPALMYSGFRGGRRR